MFETIATIVSTMIEKEQIANTSDVDTNINQVTKAINEIGKKLVDVNHGKFDN